jgi:hypothetical protein
MTLIVAALVIPPTKWAARGPLAVPVQVFEFDALQGTPIAGAEVTVFRAPLLTGPALFAEFKDRFDPKHFRHTLREIRHGIAGPDGSVLVEYEFRTGANYERPEPYVHLWWAWVSVRAPGYGGAIVPVRHESSPTKPIKKLDFLPVPVGLVRAE